MMKQIQRGSHHPIQILLLPWSLHNKRFALISLSGCVSSSAYDLQESQLQLHQYGHDMRSCTIPPYLLFRCSHVSRGWNMFVVPIPIVISEICKQIHGQMYGNLSVICPSASVKKTPIARLVNLKD